jgi:DNA processing protein
MTLPPPHLQDPRFHLRPISPFNELGAYEAMWTEPKSSFRWLADKFREHPGSLPSDFVPEAIALQHAERVRQMLTAAGIKHFGVRVHGTAEYPESLRCAEHPVELLYFQGWCDLVNSRSVAVIGTREPSGEGRARAKKLVRRLVEDDVTVVSGLARGIDTVVHQTAIESDGRTIAVLGTPLNVRYPQENAELQALIAREHLVISQVPVIRYSQALNPTANHRRSEPCRKDTF